MRDAFVRTLSELAIRDRHLMLLTADLGFGVLTNFAATFPRQFLNVGVAEQNLAGIAAGLAIEGHTVFTYSIANFPTLRCLEQLRNDVCHHNLNVKIVAVGGGFTYGPLGASHHATEDLAIMRSLPNMTVVAPGDSVEASLAAEAVYAQPGPCYLRLDRGGDCPVHLGRPDFNLGSSISLPGEGSVALLSTGAILSEIVTASRVLAGEGIETSVHSFHTLSPLDVETIHRLATSCKLIVTVEEHSIVGGLGGAVAEVLAEIPGPRAQLMRVGVRPECSHLTGSQQQLRELHGLSAGSIAARIREYARSNSVVDRHFPRRIARVTGL